MCPVYFGIVKNPPSPHIKKELFSELCHSGQTPRNSPFQYSATRASAIKTTFQKSLCFDYFQDAVNRRRLFVGSTSLEKAPVETRSTFWLMGR